VTITATFANMTADGTGYVFTFDNAGTPYGSVTVYSDSLADAEAAAAVQCANLTAVLALSPPTP
jgi:hypothetical protein